VAATAVVNAGLRKAIFAAADSPRVRSLVRRYGMRLGAARFVAGETFDDAVPVLRRLNERGLATNTTLLGEGVRERAETQRVVSDYREILDRIAAERLRCNVALKLTHLGLDIDEELALENVREIVAHARDLDNFIRIDMEQSAYVDATLRTYRRLREDGLDNVGTVLQAYLYRTERDLAELLPLRPNLRIVKGAYLEPESIAYPRKADVDAAYARIVDRMLAEGGFTAVATHDERLIEHALRAAAALYGTSSGTRFRKERAPRFQIQMLYGVRPQLQLDLVRRGHDVLVATPYGPEWYPYLMRRLGERPANLLFLIRNAVRR
jgi:proline dehydrogenase